MSPIVSSGGAGVALGGVTSVTGTPSAGQVIVATSGTAGAWTSLLGRRALVYRYTVAGSDKASIDTGVDTADAGSNDWTAGDLLEVFFMARTDEVSILSSVTFTFNNDTGTNYNYGFIDLSNATVTGGGTGAATTSWQANYAGASAAASVAGAWTFKVPAFAGTTFFKTAVGYGGIISGTTRSADVLTIDYLSASAITRIAMTPTTALKKFKVGSQLLIYKSLAS